MDDRELVERARHDAQAFGELYDRYFDRVHRLAAWQARNEALADEITADVFFKALRALPSYRDTGCPFSAWLFQITRNAVADHFRRAMKEVEIPADVVSTGPDPLEEVLRRDRMGDVWAAIDRLPGQQRTVMILRFGEDRSTREIARLLSKSEAAVKLLVFRAMRRLRRELVPVNSPHPGPSGPTLALT